MQQKRAGPLYSRLGCGTAVVLLILLGAILRFRGGGPFSPGPLSAANTKNQSLSGYTSHAAFEEECALCHTPWSGVSAERCEVCHTGVASHRLGNSGLHGLLPDSGRCDQCHTEHQGRSKAITIYDLRDFEHDWLTNFTLEGHLVDYKSEPIVCEDCHQKEQYTISMLVCQDCHAAADPVFMADHARLYGDDCQACHDGQAMTGVFDHQTIFLLDGAHSDLECTKCHIQPVVMGTPNQCHGCHQEPDIHAGQFGLECFRCHETNAWIPAQLKYHTFPLDHGDENESDCQVCHIASYSDYSCYDCHAHDQEAVRSEHLEEGISDIGDCISCHPTGLEDEADFQESG